MTSCPTHRHTKIENIHLGHISETLTKNARTKVEGKIWKDKFGVSRRKKNRQVKNVWKMKYKKSRLKQKRQNAKWKYRAGSIMVHLRHREISFAEDRRQRYGNGLLIAFLADCKQDLGKAYSLWWSPQRLAPLRCWAELQYSHGPSFYLSGCFFSNLP